MSVGNPSVMFLRMPSKKLISTRLPGSVPGTSSNTKHGALSVWYASSDTMPMSFCQDRPLAVFPLAGLRRPLGPLGKVVVGERREGVWADAGGPPAAKRGCHAVRLLVLFCKGSSKTLSRRMNSAL